MHFSLPRTIWGVSQMCLVMYVCLLGKKRKRKWTRGRELEQVMMKAIPLMLCPVIKTLLVLPKASRLYTVICAPEELMSLDRGAGAGMFSCGLHRSSFISSVHRLQLNEGEGGKASLGLVWKRKIPQWKRGEWKKTLAFSEAETKKRTSADQTAVRTDPP